MGALNFAYPDALHVGTAIWQAQADGALSREAVRASAPVTVRSFAAPASATQSPAAGDAAGVAALWEVLRMLDRARDRLAGASREANPPLAVVFASKMLWTRFAAKADGLAMQPHAGGPERGDVVVITEPVVIQAMLDGQMSLEQALGRGVLRLYAEEPGLTGAKVWLGALAPAGKKES